MKRVFLSLLAVMVSFVTVHAQDSKLNPGIYSSVEGNMTSLTYANGSSNSVSNNLLGVEIGKSKFKYKGETSGVQVTDKIVMVINPDKKVISKTPKKYDPFIKSMTPANIIIVPLEVVNGNRIYDEGTSIEGFNTTRKARVEFEWQMTDDNTFEITADFAPGEYGIVFRSAKLAEFDFTSIYGFTVSE